MCYTGQLHLTSKQKKQKTPERGYKSSVAASHKKLAFTQFRINYKKYYYSTVDIKSLHTC